MFAGAAAEGLLGLTPPSLPYLNEAAPLFKVSFVLCIPPPFHIMVVSGECMCVYGGGVQLLEPVRKPLTIRPAFEVSAFAEGDSGDVQSAPGIPVRILARCSALFSFL